MRTIRAVGTVLLCSALLLVPVNCGKRDKAPPSAVTNLRCTSPCSDKTPTFSWDAATDNGSGVDHYSVCMWGSGAAATERMWVNVGGATDHTLDDPLNDGQHTFEVKAVDKAGNKGPSLLCGLDIDTTPPTICNVSSDRYTLSSCSISSTISHHGQCQVEYPTINDTYCQVEYGTTTAYGMSQSTPLSNALFRFDNNYSVDLTGLTPNTTYHYRVKAADMCGNEAVSDDYTFHTS